ncbi:hypothetical protein mRhiFer1_009377 [Rhinolophus ferrumequinum]|uniref:Uncharacterized protein n=1 Tax=Rhinolophus ferrumequinum TaxID=59479 RepID=A0A7J7RPK8_RHIFE|nr:hypothetical protein mRhiFer1_009377 [Rhinolophus ferrumequinum]
MIITSQDIRVRCVEASLWTILLRSHANGFRRNGASWPELTHSCTEHPGSPEKAADGKTKVPPSLQASAQMSLSWPPNSATASLGSAGGTHEPPQTFDKNIWASRTELLENPKNAERFILIKQ